MNTTIIICFTLLALAVCIGIFLTKTPGFGVYSTSTVILASVLFATAFLCLAGIVAATDFIHIALAVAGFAGGLLAAKKST